MEISFDLSHFAGRPQHLISVLCNLARVSAWAPVHNPEIEEITCRTPSTALKYTRYVTHRVGISAEAEKVFLKNPGIGIRYLRVVNRSTLQDEKTHAKFWKKITRKSKLALEWSMAFNKRLSEKEEEVFLQSMRDMWTYAREVIKGQFPEQIHSMILLKSYEKMASYESHYLQEYIKRFGK